MYCEKESSELILDLRDLGWTYSALARALGVHRETTVRWASGRPPTYPKLIERALRELLHRRVPKKWVAQV